MVLAVLLPVPAWRRQASMAAINGLVRDVPGAIVLEAELVLRNIETGVEKCAFSNAIGLYVILNIHPGSYTLNAGKKGALLRASV